MLHYCSNTIMHAGNAATYGGDRIPSCMQMMTMMQRWYFMWSIWWMDLTWPALHWHLIFWPGAQLGSPQESPIHCSITRKLMSPYIYTYCTCVRMNVCTVFGFLLCALKNNWEICTASFHKGLKVKGIKCRPMYLDAHIYACTLSDLCSV